MAEFASNGKGNLGVTLGAIGTGLALMSGSSNSCGNGGLFNGGLFGNSCSDGSNCHVTRYELGQSEKIATLETQISLRDANTFTDQKLNDFRNYVDGRFAVVNEKFNQVDVYAATNTATISCMQQQIDTLKGITKTVIPNSSVCPGWGSVCVQTIDCPTTSNIVAGTLN